VPNLQGELNRSWVRRGAFSPAPWGYLVPELFRETQVMFFREISEEDEFFEQESNFATLTYLDVMAHVERLERPAFDDAMIQGRQIKVTWHVYCPQPEDIDQWPKVGDKVAFTDSEAFARELTIDSAYAPEESSETEHIEVTSSELV